MPAQSEKPTIYILGDSFALGSGVNDEQTFAYHLQMANPQYNVKLFAVGGYGLVHSYLRIEQLKSQVTERDIVIICYADFYDVRNVAAPSRLRDIENWYKKRNLPNDGSKIPVASIGNDERLSINLVSQDCQERRSYCDSKDPPLSETRAISLRLIHEIAGATPAKAYLLHFDGAKDNPVVQDCGIEVISALQDDFGTSCETISLDLIRTLGRTGITRSPESLSRESTSGLPRQGFGRSRVSTPAERLALPRSLKF